MAHGVTVPGVYLDVEGLGVLLTGAAGVGKSELALALIARGHGLVADDCTEFILESGHLVGSCPYGLGSFLEVRGLGILNVATLFGEAAHRESQVLGLVIHLETRRTEERGTSDRLATPYLKQSYLGAEVMAMSFTVGPQRDLALMVEVAVRTLRLQREGYDASVDFQNRQGALLRSGAAAP